jgi:Holliday junction resolvase RusA-like endonuclease
MLWSTATELQAFVAGPAVPKGNMRAFTPKGWARPIITDGGGKSLKLYASGISNAARAEMERRGLVVADPDQPFELHAVFYRDRPKSHRTASGALKANAPAFPTSAPDFDKLVRSVCDALTKVIYADDSRIVRAVIEKRFADENTPEGTWFRVRALAATHVELQRLLLPTSPQG